MATGEVQSKPNKPTIQQSDRPGFYFIFLIICHAYTRKNERIRTFPKQYKESNLLWITVH